MIINNFSQITVINSLTSLKSQRCETFLVSNRISGIDLDTFTYLVKFNCNREKSCSEIRVKTVDGCCTIFK